MLALVLSLSLTNYQMNWLNLSLEEGKHYGYPLSVAALIYEESSFCANRHHLDGQATGCGGLHADTASFIERRYVGPGELEDAESSIRLASDYFHYCLIHTPNWRTAVYAYRYGVPASTRVSQEEVNKNKYVNAIIAKVKELENVRQDED